MAEKITWLDSASTDRWHDPSGQKYKPVKCVSYGKVVHEDNTSLSIAGTVEAKDQVCGVMTIPIVAILKRQKLTTN